MTNNNLNDDSNPQQGSTAPTQIHSPTNGPPTDNTMFKIPPTKKDNRKLFVGGLPPKGKSAFVIDIYCSHFGVPRTKNYLGAVRDSHLVLLFTFCNLFFVGRKIMLVISLVQGRRGRKTK